MSERMEPKSTARWQWHRARFVIKSPNWCVPAALAVAAIVLQPIADACPFCSAVQRTLSQELQQVDVAVIAQLIEPMPDLPATSDRFAPGQLSEDRAKFRILKKIRGSKLLEGIDEIEVIYFGEDQPDKRFLITGISDGQLDWTTPLPLSQRAVEYVQQLGAAPESGADRLAFFQEYLEDNDPLLAQDSYDEFARAPYDEVIELGPRMHRERLLEWINDPNVGPSGRRLYLTMLGVCGKDEDVETLEKLVHFDHAIMEPGIAAAVSASQLVGSSYVTATLDELVKAEERRKKESLDALLACYLTLKGPSGLELVNQKFLGNPNTEYKYMHSAIMALRFHAAETEVLPREDLIASLRLALDHPDFADQIVPDLAQLEDWDVMSRLVQMYKEPTGDDWIRRPVASFLLVASEQPGDVGRQAAAALDDLEKLDPKTIDAVRRLSAFSLLAAGSPPASSASTAGSAQVAETEGDAGQIAEAGVDELETTSPPTVDESAANAKGSDGSTATVQTESTATAEPSEKTAGDVSPVAATPASGSAADDAGNAASAEATSTPAAAVAETTNGSSVGVPNRLALIGVPLLGALVLFAVFAALLRGGDSHTPTESP